jgi:TP901 family phage tail tape measure protein
MTTAAGRVVLTFDIDDKGVVKGLGAIDGKIKDAGEAIRKQGQGLKDWGEGLTKYVTAPLLGVGGAALAVGLDFEKSMNSIQGVLQPTAAQMERIRATAIKMGADTAFSATDAADAMLELGKAGFDTDTAIASVDEVLQLAAASGLSMADSASLAARTLNAFGLEATDLGHVNDVLAKSVNATSLEIGDLQVAFGYVGPIATGFGMSIETVSAALGIMRDNGIAAETTGRALREGFTRLVNPTKDVREVMEELGIETFKTADGGMMSLSDIIGILEEKGINTGQAMKMFGDAAGPGMAALVSKGRGALDALTAQLEKSDGAAKAMADAMMTGLPGALERLKGSVETALLSISKAIEPAAVLVMDKLGGAADIVTNVVVPAFVALPDPVQAAAFGFLALAAAAGPTLLIAGQLVIAWGHATTALGVGGVAGAAGLAAKGIGLVGVAFAGWQIGKWIGEITGLTGAIQGLTERFFDLRNTAEPVESQQRVIAQAIALGADKAVTFAQALQFLKERAAALREQQVRVKTSTDDVARAAGAAAPPVVDLAQAKERQAKAAESARKWAKALSDELERQKGLVSALGLVTRSDAIAALDDFTTTVDAATAAGVPLDRVLAALRPRLVDLIAAAQASGIYTRDMEEALAELDQTVVRLRGGIPQLTTAIRATLPSMAEAAGSIRVITNEEMRATTESTLLARAYETLGIETQASLDGAAEAARVAYRNIAASGKATAAELQAARQAVEDAEIKAGQRGVSIWKAYFAQVGALAKGAVRSITDQLLGISSQLHDEHRRAADDAREAFAQTETDARESVERAQTEARREYDRTTEHIRVTHDQQLLDLDATYQQQLEKAGTNHEAIKALEIWYAVERKRIDDEKNAALVVADQAMNNAIATAAAEANGKIAESHAAMQAAVETASHPWKDRMVEIWGALKTGVQDILSQMLSDFIGSFLGGMLDGLNGWARQAGAIMSRVFGMGSSGMAGMSGMFSPSALTAPGMGAGAGGGVGAGAALGMAGLGVAAAGAGYTLGKMGFEWATAAFGDHYISPEAQAEADRLSAIQAAEYTGAAARAGMTPEEFIDSGGTPGFDAGGEVFAGAGMDARLHGHEAVFPLPDGFDLAASLQALEQMYATDQPADASAAVPMALPTPEVHVYLGNHEFRDYVVETNLRAYEENRGGGAPVGPTTRARLALGVA